MAVAIHNVVVDTDSILTAAKVCTRAQKKDAVRGVIQVKGKRYRWSTLQQYEYHGGFRKRSKQ